MEGGVLDGAETLLRGGLSDRVLHRLDRADVIDISVSSGSDLF